MSDVESRVINMIEKHDSFKNLQDGLETVRNVEDRSEFTNRLTAEVAYILMCRAKRRDAQEQAANYGNIAINYIQKENVDTSTQAKCKPILSTHLPDLFHEGVIEPKLPANEV